MRPCSVSGRYSGSLPAIVKAIAREEGVRGFYRGVTASALTFTPASALWWPSYEGSKIAFGHFFLPKDGMSSGAEQGPCRASRFAHTRAQLRTWP